MSTVRVGTPAVRPGARGWHRPLVAFAAAMCVWAVVCLHDGNVRAYYSGKVDHSPFQSVLMAESVDGGATYGAPVQVVSDPSAEEGITMFRDPFVWQTDDGWSMAVGAAGDDQTASIRHYRSADGIAWNHVGDLASMSRDVVNGIDTGEGWECPQILSVEGTEMAIVASWSHADGPADVFAIPLAGEQRPYRVDDGHNFYAASAMRTGSWGAVLFGWVTEGRPMEWAEQAGWSGAISVPRRVWLREGRLGSEPHPALASLRVGASRPGQNVAVGAQAEIVLPVAETGTLRLRFSDTEHLLIEVDTEADTLTIDRTHASSDARADSRPATAMSAFEDGTGRPAVRILVDGSIVEVFTSAGRSLTTRVYPTQAPPWLIDGPESTLVWALGSAFRADGGVGVVARVDSVLA